MSTLRVLSWFGSSHVGETAARQAQETAAAVAVAAAALVVLWRRKLEGGYGLSLTTGLVFAVGTLVTAGLSEPFAPVAEHRRPAGRAINQSLPPGEPVYAYRSGHQPFLFYVRQPLRYLFAPEQIAPEVRYLLAQDEQLDEEAVREQLAPRRPELLTSIRTGPKLRFQLLRLHPRTIDD